MRDRELTLHSWSLRSRQDADKAEGLRSSGNIDPLLSYCRSF